MPHTVPDFVVADLHRLDLELTGGQLEHLARYLDLLLAANAQVNLTAVRDRDEAWRRLIIDSLTPLPGLAMLGQEGSGRIVDVGTGGGLPGLPLAIARPDLRFTLLDATGKKVRLIEEWIDALGLPHVTAIQNRAEILGHDAAHREQYDVAISRALGPVAVVLEYMLPLVAVGGRALLMKGPMAEAELDQAGDALDRLGAGEVAVFDAYPDSFGNELVIISVVKDRPTPRKYPRPAGMPRQSPL